MSLDKKLQIRDGQKVRVVNAPKGFSLETPKTRTAAPDVVLAFVKSSSELAGRAALAIEAAQADRLSWIAYPKAGQLDTDLNRDILAKQLEAERIKPVRQVAIDSVWSALRFRPA